MKYKTLLICLFACLYCFAQNDVIKGKFIGNNLEKSYINVININKYKATISQLDGRFEIEAEIGDSILISSIQYHEIKFLIKPDFFQEVIEIPLKLKVNQLKEVNINSLGLSGDLAKDAKSIKTNNFSQTQLGFPAHVEHFTREERRLHAAMSSQGGLPIDYIFNLINGNIKMYKMLVDNERTDKSKNKLLTLFPPSFYDENLNMPDNLVEDFLYYCLENYPDVIKLAKEENNLELIELLPSLAKEYMALKESEKDLTQKIDD